MNKNANDSFCSRLEKIRQEKSLLCIGLDPSPEQLRAWGLTADAQGVREFSKRLIETCADQVGVFKPQAAFYEQFGPKGYQVAQEVLAMIASVGAVSILDCKRGDIGNTMAAYARGILGPGSDLAADSITVTAYLGYDALETLLARARQTRTTVFVVVRSSNPEGAPVQLAKLPDGTTVSQSLALKVKEENQRAGRRVAGAVVGATLDPADERENPCLPFLQDSWILAPGIGAQGADISDLPKLFGTQVVNVVPTVSRAVAAVGPQPEELRTKVGYFREQLLRQYDLC